MPGGEDYYGDMESWYSSFRQPEKTGPQQCYEGNIITQIGSASNWSCQRANYLEAQYKATVEALNKFKEDSKAQIMNESFSGRRNKIYELTFAVLDMQRNAIEFANGASLGELDEWLERNPGKSAFRTVVEIVREYKQTEDGINFARVHNEEYLRHWLRDYPSPSNFRKSIENVYKEITCDLQYCGERHAEVYDVESLRQWLRHNTSPSPFRTAVEKGLQIKDGRYTAEHYLISLDVIGTWLQNNPSDSPFRLGVQQVFWLKQSECGRIFGESNILNHIWGWLQQNPSSSPFRSSMEQVYKEKIIEDLVAYDGSKSDTWWNNPDAQLEYLLELLEQLGKENPFVQIGAELKRLQDEASHHRMVQRVLEGVVSSACFNGQSANHVGWQAIWNALMQNPIFSAAIINYIQKENAGDSSGLLYIPTYWKPDKVHGGFLAKAGREFNKWLGSMGPIGKIIKPLIQIAALTSGNPYAVIATSVTLGALDGNREGALKALMPGIAGALGQQLALANKAKIPLFGGVQTPIQTTITNTVTSIVTQIPNVIEAPHSFYKNLAGMGLGALASTISVPFMLEGQSDFVIALGEGTVYGLVSSGVQGRNAFRGAFDGAFFSSLGCITKDALSSAGVESERLRRALGAGISSTVYLIVKRGKVKDVVIGFMSGLMSNMVDGRELQALVSGVISTIAGNADLGMAMMASQLGANVRDMGETLGNSVISSTQETTVVQPTRLAITDGSNGGNQESNDGHNVKLVHNGNPNEQQPISLKERMENVNKFFDVLESKNLVDANKDFSIRKNVATLKKWLQDHPEDANFNIEVKELYTTDKYIPCIVAGGIDDLPNGIVSKFTDEVCLDKNSLAYKFGDAASKTLWLFRGSKAVLPLVREVLKDLSTDFKFNCISEKDESDHVKNK